MICGDINFVFLRPLALSSKEPVSWYFLALGILGGQSTEASGSRWLSFVITLGLWRFCDTS